MALNGKPEDELEDLPEREIERPEKLETENEIIFEDDPDREPSHPGETLENYIEYYGLKKGDVVETLDVSFDTISKICNGRRTTITTDMALRFSKLFDTSAQFWLNLSQRRKIWEERQKKESEYDKIEERVKQLDISGKGHGQSV